MRVDVAGGCSAKGKTGKETMKGITISSLDGVIAVVVAQIVTLVLGMPREEEYYELHASLGVHSKVRDIWQPCL